MPRLETEDQVSNNGKEITLFSVPIPAVSPARAPRLAAAQLLFSVEIGSKPPRIAEARSSNKERSWVQVFYRIVEFAANIGGLNINAEL